MSITRTQIEQRIAEIQGSINALEAQLNSAMGNLQDCQYWLSLVDNSDTTDNAGAYGSSSREDADRTGRA
jgi:hypothetical protein